MPSTENTLGGFFGALMIYFDPDTSRKMFHEWYLVFQRYFIENLLRVFKKTLVLTLGPLSTPLANCSESEEYSIIFDETCFNVVISEGSI